MAHGLTGLSRAQASVLCAFVVLQDRIGMSPTLRELGSEVDRSFVTVSLHVDALCDLGALKKLGHNVSRGLQLTRKGKRWTQEATARARLERAWEDATPMDRAGFLEEFHLCRG